LDPLCVPILSDLSLLEADVDDAGPLVVVEAGLLRRRRLLTQCFSMRGASAALLSDFEPPPPLPINSGGGESAIDTMSSGSLYCIVDSYEERRPPSYRPSCPCQKISLSSPFSPFLWGSLCMV